MEVALLESPLPFWFRASLSPTTIGYTLALTVLAAGVAGVVPGLKVTRNLSAGLRESSAGAGGLRIGGGWTVVIVCQIAVTVVAPVVAVAVHLDSLNDRGRLVLPLEDEDYLTARVGLDEEGSALAASGSSVARYRARLRDLEDALSADPRVTGVTFAERLPRMYHPYRQVEVEGPTAEPPDERGHRLGSAAVALDYFEVMGVRVVAGRAFDAGDLGADVGAVIVNESFVERVMGGRNPVGRRVRYVRTEEDRVPPEEPGPWMEIVGVVEDLGTTSGYGPTGLYHPADPAALDRVHVAIHVAGGATSFAPTLLQTAFGVDPALRIDEVQTLAEVVDSERAFYGFWTFVAGATAAVALLLSLGGIYSVMAFTVARRTREIGIRVALGSSAPRVLADILKRPLTQIAVGLVAGGALLGAVIVAGATSGAWDARVLGLFAAYMTLMAAVCLAAGIVPTRRALGVEPAEALGDE